MLKTTYEIHFGFPGLFTKEFSGGSFLSFGFVVVWFDGISSV